MSRVHHTNGASEKVVLTSISGRVYIITLNRPKALNAINDQLTSELKQALLAAEADINCGCVVITGEGRAFAAGADIKEMKEKSLGDIVIDEFPGKNWNAIDDCKVPIIAAVNGLALGGGCEFAMMCDIIIASEKAKFGQPEINLGVIPGAGGTQRLTKAIGKSKSMELTLTGGMLDAVTAEKYNLVSRVVKHEELMDEAMKIANQIASKSRATAMLAKESVNTAFETNLKAGIRVERQIFRTTFGLNDRAEGMQAFVDKRDPKWSHS